MSRRDAILGDRAGRPPFAREQGAVAVEAAFIMTFLLIPVLLGVITFGMYFWQAQKAEPLSQRLPVDGIVGQFNCAELVDRVKTTVRNALPGVSDAADGLLPLDDIGVTVVDVLPTIGVDIRVSIVTDPDLTLGGLVPLPNDGKLVSEATYRLENVQLTTAGC